MSVVRSIPAVVALALALVSCGSPGGGDLRNVDSGATTITPLLGSYNNPSSASHLKTGDTVGGADTHVIVIVGAVDTYNESKTGYRQSTQATGNVFVQDPGNGTPFSGAILFRGTARPVTYIAQPGDAIEISNGSYQSYGGPSTVPFPIPLPEIGSASYMLVAEGAPPVPADITLDILADNKKGQPYLGRVVRLSNVAIAADFPGPDLANPTTSKVNREAPLTAATSGQVPTVDCELAPVDEWKAADGSPLLKAGRQVKSITGVLDYFGNASFGGFKIAPRSIDDIVP